MPYIVKVDGNVSKFHDFDNGAENGSENGITEENGTQENGIENGTRNGGYKNEKTFQCSQCNANFTLKGNLTRHMQTIHEGKFHYMYKILTNWKSEYV